MRNLLRVCILFVAVIAVAHAGSSHLALGQTPVTGQKVECRGGTASGYPCRNVDLLSFLPVSSLGGEIGVALNDIWGWTDPNTGTEYALVGRTDGIAFVDVSNPTNPVYLGELPSHTGSSSWRDVKVYENHAFVVSEASDHGMQVFDLTRLRSVANPPVTFSETAHYDRFETAHNIVLNTESGYAYAVGLTGQQDTPSTANCGAGLHIVDVTTPDQPQFAGCFTDFATGGQVAAGYTHDAQCVTYQGPDPDYQGHEICFNANERQLNIADVTNKNSPTTISNSTYPNTGYVHQAWLTESRRYLLVDDELDEKANNGVDSTRTLVFEVSDLDNPVLVERYTGSTSAIDHNQYVKGHYSYQANYESGLRILDVADPENPGEAAYFDTFTGSNQPVFNGAWSNYPYFDSGIVVVSSISEGLFVLEPNLQRASILSFDIRLQDREVIANWLISATANTDRMIVERKPPGGRPWREMGRVDGQSGSGTHEYDAAFPDLSPGLQKFRLRHVQTNGQVEVSPVDSVRIRPNRAFEVTNLENPFRGRQQFELIAREEQRVHVALYDVLGRRVEQLYQGRLRAGVRKRFTLRPTSSGIHFLRVRGASGHRVWKIAVTQ